jgi:uncharacterized protein YehS (DUF1456 family)
MTNNDVLRSIRYTEDYSETDIKNIFALTDTDVSVEKIQLFLLKDEAPNAELCDDLTLTHFLDGLIYHKRGKDPLRPVPKPELPLLNNTVLKKLRVAYKLQDNDMHAIISGEGLDLKKTEMNALFRARDHRNFVECGDQILRYFLRGLTKHVQQ